MSKQQYVENSPNFLIFIPLLIQYTKSEQPVWILIWLLHAYAYAEAFEILRAFLINLNKQVVYKKLPFIMIQLMLLSITDYIWEFLWVLCQMNKQ